MVDSVVVAVAPVAEKEVVALVVAAREADLAMHSVTSFVRA